MNQICSKRACWKDLFVYFHEQIKFLNLVSIFPSKSEFSQHCFLCGQKGAERAFFEVFLTLLEAENSTKLSSNFWAFLILHEESKNLYFSSREGP